MRSEKSEDKLSYQSVIIVQPEFKLAYYDVAIQHVNH